MLRLQSRLTFKCWSSIVFAVPTSGVKIHYLRCISSLQWASRGNFEPAQKSRVETCSTAFAAVLRFHRTTCHSRRLTPTAANPARSNLRHPWQHGQVALSYTCKAIPKRVARSLFFFMVLLGPLRKPSGQLSCGESTITYADPSQ
ncbi:hypothetical protein BD410DRAFT_795598 [Rickenella mellea]|uniref:Uncharacterized protein n=1 Tax=Rickenella mellea TaxID=50990 RepID=A0A4Y7PLS4_9AGAM|nr:hypothetical protein BD410DRAFT_795598 [Rickenella mellea]